MCACGKNFLVPSRGNTSKMLTQIPQENKASSLLDCPCLCMIHAIQSRVGYSRTLHEKPERRWPGEKSWDIREAEAAGSPWANSQGGSGEEAGLVCWRWWLDGVSEVGACSFAPDSMQVHHGSPMQTFCSLNSNSIVQGKNKCSFIRRTSVPLAKSGF